MKARGIAALLMTLALVASSAVVADAGGGQGSSVNATLLDCYVIENGTNSPYVLTLVDQFDWRFLDIPQDAGEVVLPDGGITLFDPTPKFEEAGTGFALPFAPTGGASRYSIACLVAR